MLPSPDELEAYRQYLENEKLGGRRPSTFEERRGIMNRRGFLDWYQAVNFLGDKQLLKAITPQVTTQNFGGMRYFLRADLVRIREGLDQTRAYRAANPDPTPQWTLQSYGRR